MNVRAELRRYVEAFRALSVLGRCQLALILGGLIVVAVLVASDKSLPQLTRTLTPAFFVFALGLVAFTVANENQYAFLVLVATILQHAAYITICVVGNTDRSRKAIEWSAVAVDLCTLLGYAALQIVARGTWGWHAFRQQLTQPELVRMYGRVQLLHASLLAAAGNAVLALVCAASLPRSVTWPWLNFAFVATAAAYSWVGGPFVAYCVHRDNAVGAAISALCCVIAAGCTFTAAARHSVRGDIDTLARGIAATQLWLSGVAQLLVLPALFLVRPVFGTEVMDAIERARLHEARALIDTSSVTHAAEEHRKRRATAQHRQAVDVVPAEHGRLRVPHNTSGEWISDPDDDRY